MYIETKDIGPDSLDFDRRIDYTLPRPPTGEEPVGLGGVRLTGELRKTPSGIAFVGDIVTLARLSCSRCLEPFALPLELHFDLIYTSVPEGGDKGDRRVNEDSTTLAHLDGSRIDLDELLAEQIDLGLPLKPLCRADCRGLCPRCGIDLNQKSCACGADEAPDPRLNSLKPLH